jgi:hypothetical protein
MTKAFGRQFLSIAADLLGLYTVKNARDTVKNARAFVG